jgi:hypothetical protein
MKVFGIHNDRRGSVGIEAAFTLPILVMAMVGILQFALVLQASGAMRHAIGQGIRYAKVHPLANHNDPVEVAELEENVEAIARRSLSGVDQGGIRSVQFATDVDENGVSSGTVTITYELAPLIPFASIPPIRLNETRTAYLPA